MSRPRNLRACVCVALFASCLTGAGKAKQFGWLDLSKYDFCEGDILLQHLPSKLGSVITDVTNSQYSHCGMVLRAKHFVQQRGY